MQRRSPLMVGAGVVLALATSAGAQTGTPSAPGLLPNRPSFAGIGQNRAGIDMLHTPARRMIVQTPAPTFSFSQPNCQPQQPVCNPGPYPTPYPKNCAPSAPNYPVYTQYPNYYNYPYYAAAGLYYDEYNDSRYQRGFQEGTQSAQQQYAMQAMMQAQAAAQAAAAVPALPVEPPTAIELAVSDLRAERFEQAVVEFRNHLRDNPEDAEALRLMAIAQVALKDCEDAAALMRMAYRTQPDLASKPLRRTELGLTVRELRELVTKSVSFAHKVDSASAWLTVAALMQAEGRDTLATSMLERAEKAGLEVDVAAPLKAELK